MSKALLLTGFFVIVSLSYCALSESEAGVSSSKGEKSNVTLTSQSETEKPTNATPKTSPSKRLYCDQYVTANAITNNWLSKNKQVILDFYADIVEQNTNELLLDEFARLSGIGVYRGRLLRNFNDSYYDKPPYAVTEPSPLPSETEKKLTQLFQSHNTDGIIDAITDFDFSNRYFKNNNEPKFALSFLAQFHYGDTLVQAIKRGIPITYADLVTLMQADISPDIVKQAYKASGLDAKKLLKGAFSYSSLALLALQHEQFEMAQYWIEQGSPLNPDSHSFNALDILLEKQVKIDKSQFSYLMEQTLSQVRLPYVHPVTPKLKQLTNASQQSKSHPQATLINKVKSYRSEVNRLSRQLHQQVLTELVESGSFSEMDQRCIEALGSQYVNIALSSSNDETETTNTNEHDLDVEDELTQLKQQYGSTDQLKADLTLEKSYKSKKMLFQLTLKQLEQQLTTSSPEGDSEKIEQLKDIVLQAIELANQGKWNDALTLLKSSDEQDKDVYSSLLHIAIYKNAPFEVIKQLLDNGGILSTSSTFILIENNNVELAKKLLPYGLNLDYDHPLGYSATGHAVKAGALEMLTFLLQSDIGKDIHSDRYNALDLALLELNYEPAMIEFIERLVEHGYIFELSHQQILAELKSTAPESYQTLANLFPFIDT